jgi:gliding motility-associated-like protein
VFFFGNFLTLKINPFMIRLLCIFTLVLFSQPAFCQITSTFDTDADGWTFLDSSTPITVNHQSGNGNPGGFVSVTYSASTTTTVESWFAPAKFLGSLVMRSLGRDFKFDLQQSIAGTGSSGGIAEIRIENGGNVLIYQLPVKPAVAPSWTSYSIKLDETGGWLWSTTSGSPATRAQLISVLTNVTSIEIRGTFGTNASYTSGLDNVIMEQNTLQPAPQVSSLSTATGKPGDVITINGSGFDPDPTNSVVYFGSMAGSITSVTANEINVTVPIGARHEKITVINKATGLTGTSAEPFNPVFEGGGRIIPASFKPKFDMLLDPTIGNDLNGITIGDLDQDGWNDLIVAEQALNSISIFRNLGTGGNLSPASFDTKVSIAGGGNESGVLLFDLDGDGLLDIITSYGNGSLSSFATFRNISTPGNLAFDAVERWAGNAYSGFVSNIVDIDGDGRVELIGQHGSSSVFNDLWIAQNISTPGNIEFANSVNYFTNIVDAGAGVAVGDLDNDGKLELLVNYNFGSTLAILKNTSTPGVISLANIGAISTGQYNRARQIVDVNGDGLNDIIFKFNGTQDIRIRLNTNSGGELAIEDFATEVVLASDLGNYGGMTMADINGDGKPDILASDDGDIGIFEKVYTGGVFDSQAFVTAHLFQASGNSTYPTSPLAADLNGDMKPDIIVGMTNTSPRRISIYENMNVSAPAISINTVSPLAGTAGSTVTITGSNFSAIPTENDVFFGAVQATVLTASTTELTVSVPAGATYAPVSVRKGELMSRYHLPFQTTFSVGVSFNDTHFAPPVEFTLSGANYDIEVMDLDRDGKPDIAAEGGSSLTYFFHNTHSAGTITTSSLMAVGVTNSSAANSRLADADGDGLADLVSPNGRAYQNLSTPGSISFSTDVSLGLGDSNLDFGDLNLDGKQDLVVAAGGAAQMRILENRSKVGPFVAVGVFGTFATSVSIAKPSTGGGIVMTDLDNDGFPDVAITNPGSDNLSIFHNAGRLRANVSSFNPRVDIAVGDNPGRIYIGDFDLDGRNDLILYHGTGTMSTLLTILHNQSTTGNISFNRIDLTNPSATTVAAIADLDGDGKPEIITVSETGNRFSIFKNIHTTGALSTASFDTPFNTTVTAPRGLATGDLNLDGKPEIILTRAAGLLVVYENLVPTSILTVTTQPVSSNYACEGSTASFTVAASGTTNIAYQWQRYNSGTGLFEDIADNATYSGTATATLTINNVSSAEAGEYQCVISGDVAADVITDVGNLVFNSLPSPPDVVNGVSCGAGTVTLTASGGNPGDYRWYSGSALTLIPGEQNDTYTTPSLASTTTYHVSIVDTFCESVTVPVMAIISSPPDQPTITSSISPIGNALTICNTTLLTLSAPTGYASYLWSEGSSTQQISVTSTGNYSVTVTNAEGCTSLASSDLIITVQDAPCSNTAPVITNTTLITTIGNSVSLDLLSLISDADNNLALNSLLILQQPASGAPATLNGTLMEINYNGISFTGQDAFTIQVCDVFGACTSQQLQISVIGEIEIFNALSPNNDGQNDAFIIRYIDLIPDTQNNRVTIYNRWGDVVFEVINYNNTDRVFRGQNDNGKDLPSGTYFYKIEFGNRMEMKTGYLSVRR